MDLSGGVALTRAYMRDAQLLILDEPTAALDARAEYEVFLRFSELTKGRMAVLISHRFSTVRMADRILVLKGGELVEQGTHEALVELAGLYSELFQLQAAGYRQRAVQRLMGVVAVTVVYNTGLHFNTIYVIESLAPGELRSGRELYDSILMPAVHANEGLRAKFHDFARRRT